MVINGDKILIFKIEPPGFLKESDVEDGSVIVALSNQVFYHALEWRMVLHVVSDGSFWSSSRCGWHVKTLLCLCGQ